jgi:GNAT superfamily N-acetyltransferase
MIPTIVLTDKPDHQVRTAIDTLLGQFNEERSSHAAVSQPLALILSLPGSNEVAGGLWGTTGWNYLHVELLFVPQSMRGSGLGHELLRCAENEAILRGCGHVWLDTFSFQARGFYERLGYAAFGELRNYPDNHKRFFMTKALGLNGS